MKRRKNDAFAESAMLNNSEFVMYYRRLMELAMSMFEWKNLPETVDARFLELCLFCEGSAVFFYDEALGYLTLRCIIGGKLNVYQIPEQRTAFATSGYRKPLDKDNSVIIFNNLIHTNSMLDAEMYARRLYDIDRTIDINAKAQKTPILIVAPETQRLTMKNLYMQYDGNAPFIFGDNNLNENQIKALNTGAPYVADRLYQLRTQIWNEALTYLGIANVSFEKRERMITDEIVGANGGTIACRYSRLYARKQACEQINRMFGLNIDVEFRGENETFIESESVDNE